MDIKKVRPSATNHAFQMLDLQVKIMKAQAARAAKAKAEKKDKETHKKNLTFTP